MNWKLNIDAWKSIGKGAAVAAIGAVLTYVAQNLTGSSFGENAAIYAAGFAILANYVRKALAIGETPTP